MRSTKKLVLSKETLRELTDPELRQVAGGVRVPCDQDTVCKGSPTHVTTCGDICRVLTLPTSCYQC